MIVFAIYMWWVFIGGPKFMKHRMPFNVTNLLRWYNVFQVVICSTFVTRCYFLGFDFRHLWRCESFDFLTPEQVKELTIGTWIFLFLRLFEFVETIFFILRQKKNQVSFLHVYHHITVVLLMWVYITCDTGEKFWMKSLISFRDHILSFRINGNLQRVHQFTRARHHVFLLLFKLIWKHEKVFDGCQTSYYDYPTGPVCVDSRLLHRCRVAWLSWGHLLQTSNSKSLHVNRPVQSFLFHKFFKQKMIWVMPSLCNRKKNKILPSKLISSFYCQTFPSLERIHYQPSRFFIASWRLSSWECYHFKVKLLLIHCEINR